MCSSEEVQTIVHSEMQKLVSSLVVRFWWSVVGIIFATAAAWYSLYYQVQNIEQATLNRQTNIQRDIDLLRDTYLRDIQDIKTDIRFIRESL